MILVSGGTGFVGRHLVRHLVAHGHAVRVLSRSPRPPAAPPGAEWAAGDLRDPGSLAAPLHGVRAVVHLAAILPAGGRSDADLAALNAGGTEALARAARAAATARFLHVSSAGVYGDNPRPEPLLETDPPAPGNGYERSKLAAERALEGTLSSSDVRWTILRPAGLYGPDRPATAALVPPTHVDDLVRAIAAALEHDGLAGEVINVGGSRGLEYRELIGLIGSRVGHTPVQISVPAWCAFPARGAAAAWRVAGTPPAALARLAKARVNRTVSTEKARRLLAFQPMPLERGLDETAAELRGKGLL